MVLYLPFQTDMFDDEDKQFLMSGLTAVLLVVKRLQNTWGVFECKSNENLIIREN